MGCVQLNKLSRKAIEPMRLGDKIMKSMLKHFTSIFLLTFFCYQAITQAQDKPDDGDVVRVETRVVFVDAVVKDRRTGVAVADLTKENFELFDNGKRREITYFSREGDGRRRPLALFIVLAPLDDGARKNFRRPEVVNSLTAALEKLPAQDEVGLMILGRAGDSKILADLTTDRGAIIAALTNLQKFSERKMPESVTSPKVLQDAALAIASKRPNSQAMVIILTDSVFLMNHAQRDEAAASFLRHNITFNALITGTDFMFKMFTPILKPAENDLGASWYDSPQYVARQTGGDYVRPRKKKDYGAALEKLVGTLAARYSIGFALEEDEVTKGGGQLRRLEVVVKARDAEGNERKLDVQTRQGYYLPGS